MQRLSGFQDPIGGHRGGKHDKTVFTEIGGLNEKIPAGKLAITDRVYGSKKIPGDHAKLSLPNGHDSRELANFKARVRSRHESFNGKLKMWKCMSDTFHHDLKKHKCAFEAVCVIVQYQMDAGENELFDA